MIARTHLAAVSNAASGPGRTLPSRAASGGETVARREHAASQASAVGNRRLAQ